MTLPIWFLDVDGVVNAAGVDLPDHLIRTEAKTAGTTWPIHYSPEVVEFINTVHRNRLAEIRWLTTWGPDARTSLAPAVGLDEFAAYEMYDSDDWWKAEIVAGSLADEERPVIWTDDDITEDDIAYFRDSAGVSTLVLAPVTTMGLTPADLRRITEFLATIDGVSVVQESTPNAGDCHTVTQPRTRQEPSS